MRERAKARKRGGREEEERKRGDGAGRGQRWETGREDAGGEGGREEGETAGERRARGGREGRREGRRRRRAVAAWNAAPDAPDGRRAARDVVCTLSLLQSSRAAGRSARSVEQLVAPPTPLGALEIARSKSQAPALQNV